MKHFLLSEKEESFVAKRLLVKVNEADNVAIAVKEIKAGTQVSEDLVTGGVGRSVTIFFPYSISSTDGGVGSSNINSLIQSPFSISSRAYPSGYSTGS